MILLGSRRSTSYLMMRLIVIARIQMQNLPIFLYVDRTVVVIVVLIAVVVRLVAAVVERRPIHAGVTSGRGGLLPRWRGILGCIVCWSVLRFCLYFRFGLGRCRCCRCRLGCGLVVVAESVLASARLAAGNVVFRAHGDLQIVEKILLLIVGHSDSAVTRE